MPWLEQNVAPEDIDDPYEELGLDWEDDPSPGDVKKAYKKRVFETHPDRGGDEEDFKRAEVAYQMILDEMAEEEAADQEEMEMVRYAVADLQGTYEYIRDLAEAGMAEAAESSIADYREKLHGLASIVGEEDPIYEEAFERLHELRDMVFRASVWDADIKMYVGSTDRLITAIYNLMSEVSSMSTAAERTGDKKTFCPMIKLSTRYMQQAIPLIDGIVNKIDGISPASGKALRREFDSRLGQNNEEFWLEEAVNVCGKR